MIGQIDNEDKETYILGDLNCNLQLLDQTNLDNDAKHLLRILEIYQLTQLITKPTRITQRSKSLLDVCITSCPEKIIHSDVFHVGLSDHSLVYAVRKINSLPKCNRTREIEVRNFKNFNSERFLEDLQAQPWAQLSFYEADVKAMWSCWKTMFLEVLDSHVPIRSKRVRKRPSLPWLSKGRFTRYDFVACDNGLRQAHDMIYDCCVLQKKCRSILKHVLKRCDNHKSYRRPVVSLSHARKSYRVNRP